MKTTEAWLDGGTNDRVPAASVYQNDPSHPVIIGRPQLRRGGAVNGRGEVSEPALGFTDDSVATTTEVHRATQCKPDQKRRLSRSTCCNVVILAQCELFQLCCLEITLCFSGTNRLVVPPFRLSTVGSRAFPVAAAKLWNALPDSLVSITSPSSFRHHLKTFLFQRSFS